MVVGKLYMLDLSPPARAVLLVEKALGIELEHIIVDLFKSEQNSAEYKQLNPQHTVPCYVDEDGTIISDSHAIMAYLVGKYGKNDSLYPKDLAKRAVVDQRLHFESGNVFPTLRVMVFPMWTGGEKCPTPKQIETLNTQYDFLNKFLSGKPWMAGNTVTIADFSLISSISSLLHMVPIDSKYTDLLAWVKRCEQLPYYEANGKGARAFKEFVKPFLIQ
ncbi:glutathione S-transferase 1-like [Atheta coriaria]|uniref:glutathione S-transferase 1-like n=1 Tax=Dalotia coriaria TaxID=877792 RepID=UPI0031F443F5